MSIDSDRIKVQIFENYEDLYSDLIEFFSRKSVFFKRESIINNLLNEYKSDKTIFKSNQPIPVEEVYGSTYQSSYRKDEDIYAISHTIHSIGIDKDGLFAILEPSKYGTPLDFSKGLLRPVWYKNEKDEFKLATFDIDFNIISNAA